jgi:hypothetical protein
MTPPRRRLEIATSGRRGARSLGGALRAKREALRERAQRDRKEREIYEAISFLRNVCAVGMGRRMSADLALQRLSENGGALRPVYARALSLLRMNRRKEAERCFEDAVGGGLGRDFIRVVMQWDEIDPDELVASLLSYQKSIKETRITAQKKKDELVSDLIYLPVVANILIVFLNFIFVAYFVEQKDMLAGLFF